MKFPGSAESRGGTASILVPLVAGTILIEFYAIVASHHGFFVLPDFSYHSSSGTLMLFYLPEQHLSSMLWKFLFLLPAAVLVTIGLGRSGIQLSFPRAGRDRLILGALLAIVLTVLVLSARFLFHETEVTDDENVYDFEARTLLTGRLSNPGCPATRCFDNQFIINNKSVREGKYTLGHPAVVAMGMALGDRYIGLFALSALTVLLLYRISLELYADRVQALLVACLTCLSPFFYFMSSSLLSHTTSAFFLALFMYLFLRVRSCARVRTKLLLALCAGLALGYAFNVRQLTALGFAVPFCAAGVAELRNRKPGHRGAMVLIIAGFGATLVLTLWMNHALTGDALLFPFNYYDAFERMGFGVHGHTLSGGINNLSLNLLRLNAFLFGFPASLMFVLPVLVAKKEFGDRLSLGIFASIGIAYIFYFSPGVSDLGPVYFYEMVIPGVLLSGRGIMILHRFAAAHVSDGRKFVPLFVAVSSVLALCTFFPERAAHVSRLTDQIRQPYALVDSLHIHHAVVMIQSTPNKGFVFGYRNASPTFQDDMIYCRFADTASNTALTRMFTDRRFYTMRYSPEDGRSFISEINREGLSP